METGNNSKSGGAAGGGFSDCTAWEGDKSPPLPAVFAYMCARRRERRVLAEDARARGVRPRSAAPVTASERVIVTAPPELLGLRRVRGRFVSLFRLRRPPHAPRRCRRRWLSPSIMTIVQLFPFFPSNEFCYRGGIFQQVSSPLTP